MKHTVGLSINKMLFTYNFFKIILILVQIFRIKTEECNLKIVVPEKLLRMIIHPIRVEIEEVCVQNASITLQWSLNKHNTTMQNGSLQCKKHFATFLLDGSLLPIEDVYLFPEWLLDVNLLAPTQNKSNQVPIRWHMGDLKLFGGGLRIFSTAKKMPLVMSILHQLQPTFTPSEYGNLSKHALWRCRNLGEYHGTHWTVPYKNLKEPLYKCSVRLFWTLQELIVLEQIGRQLIKITENESATAIENERPQRNNKSAPSLQLICTQNCESVALLSEPTVLLLSCLPDFDHLDLCLGQILWRPKLAKTYPPKWSRVGIPCHENRTFTIPAFSFVDGEEVEFVATLNDIYEVKFQKIIYREDTHLTLKCSKNCEHFNLYTDTIIHGVCRGICDSRYVWTIEPKTIEKFLTFPNNETLVLAANFSDKPLTVRVTVANGNLVANISINFGAEQTHFQFQCHPKPIFKNFFSPYQNLYCNTSANIQQWIVPSNVELLNNNQTLFIPARTFEINEKLQILLKVKNWRTFEIKWGEPFVDLQFRKFHTGSWVLCPLCKAYNITLNMISPLANLQEEFNYLFQGQCFENCNPTDPQQPIKLLLMCDLFCSDLTPHVLQNSKHVQQLEYEILANKKMLVTIPKNTFLYIAKNQTNLQLEIILKNFNRVLIDLTTKIYFPKLILKCFPENCENLTSIWNNNMRHKISVSCYENCNHITDYQFNISNKIFNANNTILIPAHTCYTNLTIYVKNLGPVFTKLTKLIKFKQPLVNIQCKFNCKHYSHPKYMTLFNCDNCQWIINKSSVNKSKLIIEKNSFKDGDHLLIKASRCGILKEKLIQFREPIIEINCTENCSPSIPLYNVKLKIYCPKCLHEDFKLFPKNISILNDTLSVPKKVLKNYQKIIVQNRFSHAVYVLNVSQPESQLHLLCVNCADVDQEIKIKLICTKNCFRECPISWHVRTPHRHLKQGENTLINKTLLIFKENTFNYGDVINIQVKFCQTKINKTIAFVIPKKQLIEIRRNISKFYFRCKPNCNFKNTWILNNVYSNNKTINLPRSLINFTITLLLDIRKDATIQINSEKIDCFLCQMKIEFDCQLRCLIFNYKSYLTPFPVEFSKSAEFPSGVCKIYPNVGIALFTEFTINCSGFPSGVNYLIYQGEYDVKTNKVNGVLLSWKTDPKTVLTLASDKLTIVVQSQFKLTVLTINLDLEQLDYEKRPLNLTSFHKILLEIDKSTPLKALKALKNIDQLHSAQILYFLDKISVKLNAKNFDEYIGDLTMTLLQKTIYDTDYPFPNIETIFNIISIVNNLTRQILLKNPKISESAHVHYTSKHIVQIFEYFLKNPIDFENPLARISFGKLSRKIVQENLETYVTCPSNQNLNYTLITVNQNVFWLENVTENMELPFLLFKTRPNVYRFPIAIHYPLDKKNFTIIKNEIDSVKSYEFYAVKNSQIRIVVTLQEEIFFELGIKSSNQFLYPPTKYRTNNMTIEFVTPVETLNLVIKPQQKIKATIKLQVLTCLSTNGLKWMANECRPILHTNEFICFCQHLSGFSAKIEQPAYTEEKVTTIPASNFVLSVMVPVSCIVVTLAIIILIYFCCHTKNGQTNTNQNNNSEPDPKENNVVKP